MLVLGFFREGSDHIVIRLYLSVLAPTCSGLCSSGGEAVSWEAKVMTAQREMLRTGPVLDYVTPFPPRSDLFGSFENSPVRDCKG